MQKAFTVTITMMVNADGETRAVAASQNRVVAQSDWYISADQAYSAMSEKLGAWISDRF